MSYYSITTVEKFREYKMETLVQVVEEAKRLGIDKGFEYEKDDGVLGLRKYKIKNIADDFDVHCNTFMSVDAIEIKDGWNTKWLSHILDTRDEIKIEMQQNEENNVIPKKTNGKITILL